MDHEFLRSIADGYIRAERENLRDFAFIFPNARSAEYFNTYLKEEKGIDSVEVQTRCLPMSKFIELAVGMHRASRNELLLAMHTAYTRVSNRLLPDSKPQEFDRFRFWAEMLIRDFDEIDRYMVNPESIFKNVANFKDLQSHYLTPEQEEVIRNFWGEDLYWQRLSHGTDSEEEEDDELPLWKHTSKGDAAAKFVQLWDMLLPIYHEFRKILEERSKIDPRGWEHCYPGMAYRRAAETLMAGRRLRINPKKYVFIGFHRLSTSEHIIFDILKREERAHFYWEYDPALMDPNKGNKAGRFIAKYQEYFFESHPEVILPPIGGLHNIEIIGVGSNSAQAKVAATLLENAPDDTALVLPGPELLLPLMSSVPENIEHVNITMGYPLRFSQLAQLYSSLAMLHIRARHFADGRIEFFRGDILRLLSNPLLKSACSEEIAAIEAMMKSQNLYNLPAEKVSADWPIMAKLLAAVSDPNDIRQVADYTRGVLHEFSENNVVGGLDAKVAETLVTQIDEIVELSEYFSVKMVDNTFFHMLEKALFHESVALTNKSFEKLQIMGVLETRCLGFENVIMLSMTDAVFPGRTLLKSFIPAIIRSNFGLPTHDHYEADSAYYFFRLLSRTKNLTMVYDARQGGLRSGEKSRFIEQLLHMNFAGVTITSRDAVFNGVLKDAGGIKIIPENTQIAKSGRIRERLERYITPPAPGKKPAYKLSASALKTYIHCPMQFYFERVEDMHPADLPTEHVDALMTGNIIHETAETLYKKLKERGVSHFTRSVIDEIVKGGFDDILRRELHRSINVNYIGVPREITDPETEEKIPNPEVYTRELKGEAEVYYRQFLEWMEEILQAEPEVFDFLDAELSETFSWPLKNGINLNFTMKIDRLDQVGATTRLVDYKTGNDSCKFNREQIFLKGNTEQKAAIFQLLTYCYAYIYYSQANGKSVEAEKVKPLIYSLKNIPDKGETFPDLSYNRKPLTSYQQVQEWFEPDFEDLIGEIFNFDIPFKRTDNEKMCEYCKFKQFCH